MTKATATRILMDKRLAWTPIRDMRVSETSQRKLNEARVAKIAAKLDPEQLGNPTVNLRGEHWWIIDGQHRIEAVRRAFGDTQQMQCWQYTGLTIDQEAEAFLKINDVHQVRVFDKFRIGLEAGRLEECEINRIVRAQDLVLSEDGVAGAIRAVATVRRLYRAGGEDALTRTLRIICGAYGDQGLDAPVIAGLGMVVTRYNGQIGDEDAVRKLADLRGGLGGLMTMAGKVRAQVGCPMSYAVAASAIEVLNRGRRGKAVLPGWWKAPA